MASRLMAYKFENMPTNTITFTLPDEEPDMRDAINGYKYSGMLWDIDQQLRQTVKYGTALNGNGEATPAEIDAAERVRDMIREKADSWGVVWDEIG